MGTKIVGRIALMSAIALGGAAHPAPAQTVTWVTPPPATAPSGGSFTVQWEASGFVGPFISNAVAWGQTSLLGETPGTPIGGDVYEAVVKAPVIHGTLNVVAVFETAGDGQVLSPIYEVGISALDAIAELQATVSTLMQYIEVGTHNNQPVVRFTGVNVQVVNGADQTTVNGLGNLIVGYDEDNIGQPLQPINAKNGSHNLVVGNYNSYGSVGGVVFGIHNAAMGPFAAVTGGKGNRAMGAHASVAGGAWAEALGDESSVTGGQRNVAAGTRSSVTGGDGNIAGGYTASVTGGTENRAEGGTSAVSGGYVNRATGNQSWVAGGDSNVAIGERAVVLGGGANGATGLRAVVLGGERNEAMGLYATVTGGRDNVAVGENSSLAGGDDQTNASGWTVLAEGTINPPD